LFEQNGAIAAERDRANELAHTVTDITEITNK
jgi:hypothetical protein